MTSGVAYTFLSFFKGKVDGLTVMMHFSTFSAIASIPFMLKDFVVPSFKQAVLLLLIGVFGSLGQAFITLSLIHIYGVLDLDGALEKLKAIHYTGALGLEVLDRRYVFAPEAAMRQAMDWYKERI